MSTEQKWDGYPPEARAVEACTMCGGEGRIFTSRHGGNDPDVWPVGQCDECEGSGLGEKTAPDGAHLLEATGRGVYGPRLFLAHWVNDPGDGEAPGWCRAGHEGAIQPFNAKKWWRYVSPVRTDADILAAHAEGARAGIEAAAEHHERKAEFLRESCPKQETLTHELEMAERAEEHDREALMIRALPLPPPSADALAAVEARAKVEALDVALAFLATGSEASRRVQELRDMICKEAAAIRSRQEPGHV